MELALEIARCPEIAACASTAEHPCREVVAVQGQPTRPDRQVPEAWAGNLESACVVYLSSNPSISEAGDSYSGELVEDYPRADWPDARVAEFITRRFDESLPVPWVSADRFRRTDGSLSAKAVRYWAAARARTAELLGRPAAPDRDYAMTEVVRCKSKGERGVGQAAKTCADRYLDRTLALAGARLVVVVGSKSRDRVVDLFDLPPGFGQRGSAPEQNMTVIALGGRTRAVVYLPHFTGMEKRRTFTDTYGTSTVERLRRVALGSQPPEALLA